MTGIRTRTGTITGRLVAVACGLVILGACGSSGKDAATLQSPASSVALPTAAPATPNNAIKAGDASVEISTPKDGDTVPNDIEVVVSVEGFEVVDKIGEAAKEGEGHLIYYLGRSYQAPTALGQSAASGGSGGFVAAASAQTTYTWKDTQAGKQVLTAQLVNNDNTPLDPPQLMQISVEVQG